MADEWHAPIRKYIDQYWRPLVTFVLLIMSALAGFEKAGVSPTTIFGDSASVKPWLFLGCFFTLLILIRFRRVAYWVHKILFPRPELPGNPSRIFRGPKSFGSADQGRLPGRQVDFETCLERIAAAPFFVLEGESGCGKSSLVEADVLPALTGRYRVVTCRVANDPFGKVSAAIRGEAYQIRKEPVGRKALVMAVNEAITPQEPAAAGGDPGQQLLLCIDQFEELFITVPDKVRDDFAACLQQLTETGKFRLVICIRSDFSDLLARFCRTADPDFQALNLRNYHTLRPFLADQANAVINELLQPLHGGDPIRKHEAEEFVKELVAELIRPPVDPRLSREDEKSVLPVELQTVGMMLESTGIRNLARGSLQRMGGRVGILKAYIEDVKAYVCRRADVSGPQAMLILRELISPAGTKWAVTPIAIAERLSMSTLQVKNALDAFSEKYLVKLLPPEVAAGKSCALELARYEFLHEHWVQVLTEAPDPTLQSAREAEESLRFWRSRTSSVFEASSTPQSVRAQVRRWFAHPIPFGETIRLWWYARSPDSRKMLQRTIRGYILTTALLFAAVGFPVAWYTVWIRSDAYQIDRIVAGAPVQEAEASGGSNTVKSWVQTLARTARRESALEVARVTNKPLLRVITNIARAEAVQATDAEAAVGEWEKARVAAEAIEDSQTRDEAYELLAEAFRRSNKPEKAREVEAKISPSRDPDESASRQIALLLEQGLVDEALRFAQTWLKNKATHSSSDDDAIRRIVDSYVQVGKLAEANSATSLIYFPSCKVPVLVELAKRRVQAGNTSEADKLWDEAIRLSVEDLEPPYDLGSPHSLILVATALQENGNSAKVRVVLDELLKRKWDTRLWHRRSQGMDEAASVAAAIARFGDISRGIDLAKAIDLESVNIDIRFARGPQLFPQYSAVHHVAAQSAAIGKADEAREAIAKLDEPLKSTGFLGLAVGLHDAGKHEQALKELQNVQDDRLSSVGSATQARVHVSLGQAREATSALSRIEDDALRSETIKRVAKELAQTDQFDAAADVARRIDDKGSRCEALSALAESLVEVGESNAAEKLFVEAADTASKIPNQEEQSSKLALVANAMARSKYFRLARLTANRCISPTDRLGAFVEILAAYGK